MLADYRSEQKPVPTCQTLRCSGDKRGPCSVRNARLHGRLPNARVACQGRGPAICGSCKGQTLRQGPWSGRSSGASKQILGS